MIVFLRNWIFSPGLVLSDDPLGLSEFLETILLMDRLMYSLTDWPVRRASWVIKANGIPIKIATSAKDDMTVDFDIRIFVTASFGEEILLVLNEFGHRGVQLFLSGAL